MESNTNFKRALQAAFDQRRVMGMTSIESDQDRAVAYILRHPIMMGRGGELINHMGVAHRRVRRLYIRKTWDVKALFGGSIDWEAIVEWIKENWDEIAKVIFAIVMMFI